MPSTPVIANAASQPPLSEGTEEAPPSCFPSSPKAGFLERLSFSRFRDWRRASPDDNVTVPADRAATTAAAAGVGSATQQYAGRVVPGLPHPGTFQRQDSERRERLLPYKPCPTERRALSASRNPSRTKSPRPLRHRRSDPSVKSPLFAPNLSADELPAEDESSRPVTLPAGGHDKVAGAWLDAQDPSLEPDIEPGLLEVDSVSDDASDPAIREELEARWILNLSMSFRDKSAREKFFITFADRPNKWRRVTISCDYRNAPPESLEADLKTLHYQRDKSARIYEAIRDSLPDIQFYETITNLKLQTSEGRLHVHVTEDVNEVVPWPPVLSIQHIPLAVANLVPESDVHFKSHMSGFVYKVMVKNRVYIKKEIPAPDMIEEFLYEVNALAALRSAPDVIDLEGLIVDEERTVIKGLLLSYATQGPLVDVLFDHQDALPWPRREKWARQIIASLSAVHEHGFVQGDFTLSNIVIDATDKARLIDINRRGCPVGWEPPEFHGPIKNGQRIAMFIGVKSDLYQLGMVLWALAAQKDEPERERRPLSVEDVDKEVPDYFRAVVSSCLSDNPAKRPSGRDLLARFPTVGVDDIFATDGAADVSVSPSSPDEDRISHRADKEYIDPATAVGLDDIAAHRLLVHPADNRTLGEDTSGDALQESHPSTARSAADTAPTALTGDVPLGGKPTVLPQLALAHVDHASRQQAPRAAARSIEEDTHRDDKTVLAQAHGDLPTGSDMHPTTHSQAQQPVDVGLEGHAEDSFGGRMASYCDRMPRGDDMAGIGMVSEHLGPPIHQDSGFGEEDWEEMVGVRGAQVESGPGPSDLVGVGGACP